MLQSLIFFLIQNEVQEVHWKILKMTENILEIVFFLTGLDFIGHNALKDHFLFSK